MDNRQNSYTQYINKQIHNWLILENDGGGYYKCKCVLCNKVYRNYLANILNGASTKCRVCSNKSRRHKYIVPTTDKKWKRLYNIWQNLKKRGIKVSTEWLNSYDKFYTDTHETYSNKLYIARIDKSKPLGVNNFTWQKKRDIGKYKPRSAVTINGITKSKSEWARHLGITRQAFDYRMVRSDDKNRWILPKDIMAIYNSKYADRYGITINEIAVRLNVKLQTAYKLAREDKLNIKNGNIVILE